MDSASLTPRYETSRVKLYEGSTDVVMAALLKPVVGTDDVFFDNEQVGVVLTDPPYWHWAHICASVEKENLDLRLETLWMGDVFMLTLAWLPMVRALRPGIAWFFADPHYCAIYMRVARYLKWPMVGWWPALNGEHSEYLIAFADDLPATYSLTGQTGADISSALKDVNSYGQSKSASMLERLLHLSPRGTVLDPFCGSGTSLVAAIRDGRNAIGIEMDGPIAATAEALLRSVT